MFTGGVVFLAILVLAAAAPYITSYDPLRTNVSMRLSPPSQTHLFGTDDVGRDVFTRVIYGARVSLAVGILVVLISGFFGTILGLVAGFSALLDTIIMRFMDGLMAFPSTLLAIALMAALGPNFMNVIIALSIVYAPRVARVLRSVVLVVREATYVEAANASGATLPRILWRHVLPNCVGPLVVQGTFIFAAAVLSEAALSFLGVGIPPWLPSWGNILTGGRIFMAVAPWITIYPGIAIMITVMALNLMGDGLRDVLDPHLRGTNL